MTALRPLDSWDITPVKPDEERKLLRKVIVNRTCAHPDCDKPTESVHHLIPRGTVGSSSWFVRVPGVDKPILHCVGLCGTGTTGHHGELEEHAAWVKLESGIWNWYDRISDVDTHGEDDEIHVIGDWLPANDPDSWHLLGPLAPQPGQIQHPKKKTRKQGAEKRKRRVISIAVPADEQEDGAGIFEDLVQVCRDEWAEQMGWSDTVPAYYVIVAGLYKAIRGT